MVPDNLHDFFAGSASVAGALVGLLFVAISVVGSRLTQGTVSAQLHRIRASAALSAFTNALTVSLFSLIPGHKIGYTSIAVGVAGLVFVAGALISLARMRDLRLSHLRDAVFLVGLAVAFLYQIFEGLAVTGNPDNTGAMNSIAVIVVVCFLVGIQRSWELIGAPSIAITHEVSELVRHGRTGTEPQDVAERDGAGPDQVP
jgi:uncharacterized protein involved in response to NO